MDSGSAWSSAWEQTKNDAFTFAITCQLIQDWFNSIHFDQFDFLMFLFFFFWIDFSLSLSISKQKPKLDTVADKAWESDTVPGTISLSSLVSKDSRIEIEFHPIISFHL